MVILDIGRDTLSTIGDSTICITYCTTYYDKVSESLSVWTLKSIISHSGDSTIMHLSDALLT